MSSSDPPTGTEAEDPRPRQMLLSRWLSAVKECQLRFAGKASRGELATDRGEGDREVREVCETLEAILSYGLLPGDVESTLGRVKGMLFPSASAQGTPARPTFWPFVKVFLNKHELERFYLLRRVTTDAGRCRAWLRAALNEHSLERYLLAMISNPVAVTRFYKSWSFLADKERNSMLPSMAANLASITFALRVDHASLNEPADVVGLEIPSAAIPREISREEVAVERKETESGDKVKKKRRPNVVNLDSDDNDRDSCSASPQGSASSSPGPDRRRLNHTPHDPAPAAGLERQILVSQTKSKTPNSSRAPAQESQQSPQIDFSQIRLSSEGEVREGRGAKGQKGQVRGVCGDGEEDEIDVYNTRGKAADSKSILSAGSEQSDGGNFAGNSSAQRRLTPMKNSSVGALIPLSFKESPTASAKSSEADANSEDSLSVVSFDESDYASALGTTPANSRAGSVFGSASRVGPSASRPQSTVNTSTSISREELKQALLSVMERKDELHRQCTGLKRLLSQEGEAATAARGELAEEKRRAGEAADKLQSRIQALTRENELLKHQLKKYVGAVQKLRDGPQAYETLAQLEEKRKRDEAEVGEKRYVDYHFEASEYEKKLIQVAEMHGELIEFNEHLQKTLLAKDAIILRMKEELVDLRGPLPPGDLSAGANDDSQGGYLDGDTASLAGSVGAESTTSSSAPRPPLLHIWIPSVFLSGSSGARSHHVYQVYLRIRDEEWNVYRRYSDFYALHRELCRGEQAVASFDFPPKVTVGYKAEKVVEDRRKRLQAYLRRIVNLVVQTNPSLAARPTKESVLLLMPFLGESRSRGSSSAAGVPDRKRSRSQGRSLFSRQQPQVATSQLAL